MMVGKLRAQTRAEAKGAEMKISDEQKWAVNPTNITPEPLSSPVHWRALNRAGGMPSGTNPQLNWQHIFHPAAPTSIRGVSSCKVYTNRLVRYTWIV